MRTIAPEVPFLDLGAVHRALRHELEQAWSGVVAHGQFVGGPEVARFEHEFARYCGVRHAVGVGNGTDALELALTALGIGPGDEVVVPGNTFVATAEAVCAVGARPRFVDVRPDTLLLDAGAVADAVGPDTAAVVAVHLYGQMTDVPELGRVARRHGLALVEDAAQAHGASFAGLRPGQASAAATFSFYPGKNLGALGDGGAVVTGDPDVAARVRSLSDHGRSAAARHVHDVRGRNSRLDSVQAALLSVKLSRLDEQNAQRVDRMRVYTAALPTSCPPVAVDARARSVHHLAVVRAGDRDGAVAALDAAGIGWGLHYPVPCHRQPAFAEFGAHLPVVERAAGEVLSLPLWPSLSDEQVHRVCHALTEEG